MILCIDPNTSHRGGTGLAIFEGPKLVGARLLRPPKVKDIGERIRQTVNSAPSVPFIDLAIVEWPQIYADSPVDPNQILGLAAMGMAIAVSVFPKEVKKVLPREWKGSLDGDVMAARIESRLTPEERATIHDCPKSLRHNVLDAIGLGLWHFGRLERRRVFRR